MNRFFKYNKLALETESDDSVEQVEETSGDDSIVVDPPQSEDEGVIIIRGEDLQVIETSGAEITEELQEAEDTSDDVAAIEEDISEAEEAVVAIESIRETVQKSLKKGMTAREFRMACNHVDYISKQFGLPKTELIGMESNAPLAVRIAMEGWSDVSKKIKDGIVKAVQTVLNFLRNFFQKIFTVSGRLVERAKKLLEVSAKIDDKPREAKVGNARMAKALALGDSIEVDKIPEELSRLREFAISTFNNQAVGLVNEYVKSLAEVSQQLANAQKLPSTENIAELTDQIHGYFVLLASLTKMKEVERTDKGIVYNSPKFLGNTIITYTIPGTEESWSSLGSAKKNTEEYVAGEDAKIDTANKATIEGIANQVIAIAEANQAYKKALGQLDNAGKRAIQLMSRDPAGKLEASNIRNIFKIFSISSKLVAGIHRDAYGYAIQTASTSLEYAAQSVKAYGKTEVKAAPAEGAAAA